MLILLLFKLIFFYIFILDLNITRLDINELKLVSIKNIQVGGSTSPLVIEAEDKHSNISSYILKLYNKNSINQNYSVAKEIIASEVAKEFDLPAPDYGIINFDHKYLKSVFTDSHIESLDNGYKFCSKIIEGSLIYNPSTKNNFLKDYDLENVFAFDNLILNVDRGGYHNKPNLLVIDDDFVLIDHELILPFYSNPQSININYWNYFSVYNCDKHIFYNLLKTKRKKGLIFDEFQLHLNNFNLSIFDSIFANLEYFNINNSGKQDCFDYFNWAKTNHGKIVNVLNNRLL